MTAVSASSPVRRERSALTRERVLRVAVAHADAHAHGIDGLSMRRLAAELGAGAMSLYHHVDGKDDLLDGMVDLVAWEIEEPSPSLAWKAALRTAMGSAHEVLLRHRWIAGLWGTRTPGPGKLRHFEAILRVLRQAGFSEEEACRGFHALTMHTVGFTLQLLEMPFRDQAGLASVASRFLETLPRDTHPFFAEHVEHHLRMPGLPSDFHYLLDLILDDLERVHGDRSDPLKGDAGDD